MKNFFSMKQSAVQRNDRNNKETTRFSKAIENITVHDHLCLIYKNKEEQFAAAIPFMRIGLERGEKCIYIVDDNTATEVLKAMRDGGIDVNGALKKGALAVVSKKEAYLRKGYFDPAEMVQFLTESTAQAKKEGFSALRATGEMTWMLGGEPGTDRLIEYEAKLNRFLPKNDCLALCQYNRNRFSPEILLDVIHTHPVVVVGNVVCKNFYYVPVEEFLKAGKGTSEEADRLLKNLLEREQKEEEHQNYLRFMESMDKVNRAIQGTNDLEQMMGDVLDVTISIFDCDRAWFVYPSDPKTGSYRVPMERTKPEYPGALAQGVEIPVDLETVRVFQAVESSSGPVTIDLESKPPLPALVIKNFHVQSQVAMNIYPKVDKPYMFGLHQCSFQRVWTREEKRLFQEIGRRLTDGLTSLLMNRDLKKSNIELVRINRALTMVSNINQILIHATDETTLLNEVCRIAIQEGGYLLAWVGYAEQNKIKTVSPIVQAGSGVGYLKNINITWSDEKNGRGPTGTAIRTGKTQISRDIEKDPNMLPWRQSARKYGFKSSIALPLSNEGQIFGCLTVYASEIGIFSAKEVNILEELANDLAFGIATLRLRIERTKVMYERGQFFKFFNLSTDIMVIVDPNGAFQKVNPTCLNMLGYSEADLLSKPFINFVHPDDKQSTIKEMARQIKIGSSLNFENRYLCKDGKVLWISWRANYNKDEGITYATGRDITEQKIVEILIARKTRALKIVSEINQSLIRINDETILLNETCRIAVELGGYPLVWVGFAEQNETKNIRPVAQAGFDSGYVKKLKLSWANDERGHSPGGAAIQTGKPSVVLDVAKDPIMAPWRKDALKRGYQSVIGLPLINNNKAFGVLMIYSNELNAFSDEEIKILSELASDLAFGITAQRVRSERDEIGDRFVAAFSTSPDLINITRLRDGMILEINDGYTKLLGYSHAESIGKTIPELSIWANPADRSKFIATLEKVGQVADFETIFRRKDGTLLTVLHSARIFNLKGEKCIISIVHDITDRKKAEEKIRKNEIDLREAQRIGRIGNWDWDAKTDKIYWSEEYYHITGYDLKKSPPGYAEHLKLYTPESAARLDAAVKLNMKTGEPYELDLQFAKPNEPFRWITARSETKRDAQGKIIGLRGTAQDITERKVTEEKLVKIALERERALLEVKKLAMVVENTFESVSLIDLGKTNLLLYVNSAWENMYGYKKGEVVNKRVALILDVLKRDPKMEKIFWDTVAKGEMFSGQIEWQKRNGDLFWADVHTIPLRDERGKIYMWCNVIRDVTEAKVADRAKSEFVSLASHQLRTPLTGIKWLSELLLRDPDHTLTPDQIELVQGVILSNKRTIALVDDLLDVSHIEKGKNLKLTLVSVDVIPLITFAIAEKKHLAIGKHIIIELDKTLPKQLVLTVDKEKIQQLFENLIDNAVKYSNPDTKIIVGAKFNNGDVVFFVQDHGIGIPSANQHSIFNRFFRADNAAKIDNTGTGLGLYIAKGIIEYHHGKIWFESVEGKGSTFYFSLPLDVAKDKIVKKPKKN